MNRPPNCQVEALHWALAGASKQQDGEGEGQRSGPQHPALAASAAAAVTARRRAEAAAAVAAAAAASDPAVSVTASGDGADPGYDPCVDDEVEIYLNLPEVRAYDSGVWVYRTRADGGVGAQGLLTSSTQPGSCTHVGGGRGRGGMRGWWVPAAAVHGQVRAHA